MAEETQNQGTQDGNTEHRPHKPMTPAERKKYIQELKAKKQAEKQAKIKAEKEERRRKRLEARKNSGVSGKKMPIVIISSLVVLGIAGYIILSNMSSSKIELDPRTEVQNTAHQDTVANVTDTIKEVVEPVAKEDKTLTANASGSFSLPTPCWVVSYGSFVNEKYAKINTNRLLKRGEKAGYYWIPDYNPRGNKFYKVYIGPFSSKSDAVSALQSIKSSSPTAYILKLK